MSDARALLRQQRAARRITHLHAAYSDTGKLLCTLCREPVRAENLWSSHLQSEGHRKRVVSAQESKPQQEKGEEEDESTAAEVVASSTTAAQKRKLDDDEEMGDVEDSPESMARRKRSRPATASPSSIPEEIISKAPPVSAKDQQQQDQTRTSTPPSLTRRSSTTPSQGVEVQIPSRPATPRESTSTNSASTTKTLPSRQASIVQLPGMPIPKREPSQTTAATSTIPENSNNNSRKGQIDEDEWAAFEADIEAVSYDHDAATISAPAMTAAESAAAAQEGEEDDGDPRRRKTKPEAELADEKEDARRAFEDELDEMNNLEAKVLRLKEQRDALRRRRAESLSQQDSAEGQQKVKTLLDKENASSVGAVVEEGEDEDEEDDEDEDDWDGFRFRTALSR